MEEASDSKLSGFGRQLYQQRKQLHSISNTDVAISSGVTARVISR